MSKSIFQEIKSNLSGSVALFGIICLLIGVMATSGIMLVIGSMFMLVAVVLGYAREVDFVGGQWVNLSAATQSQ